MTRTIDEVQEAYASMDRFISFGGTAEHGSGAYRVLSDRHEEMMNSEMLFGKRGIYPTWKDAVDDYLENGSKRYVR